MKPFTPRTAIFLLGTLATVFLALTGLLAGLSSVEAADIADSHSDDDVAFRGTACISLTNVTIAGPSVGYSGAAITFTANISPSQATPPITYTWQPQPEGSVLLPGQSLVTYTWRTTGTKIITVTADNCGGSDVATHTISITAQEWNIYLPLTLRNYPPPTWHSECVDCPVYIDDMTPRSIAVDSTGRTHVVYGGDHLYHAWRDDSGWQVEIADASLHVGDWASLALDDNDHPHISYYDAGNKDLKYAHWDGAAWITETVDTLGGWDTAIALDSAGRPHIAYRHATLSDMSLKYATWDGAAWQITTVESHISGASDRDTSIALDGDDHPHIGYVLSHHGSDPSDLTHTWWDGTRWLSETVETALYIGSNSMALLSTGKPTFAYEAITESDYLLRYARWDGAQWQISTLATSSNSLAGFSLVLDGSDAPHLSYYSQADEAMRYGYQDGGGWQFETVASGLHTVDWGSDVTALALDGAGQPRISYFAGRHTLLKYAVPAGGGWQTETIVPGGKAGKYPSLALDGDGNPHISYLDEGQGSIKYAAWEADRWVLRAIFQMEFQDDNDWIYGLNNTSLALDGDSRPHVVYNYNGALGLTELRYTFWDGSAWQTQVIVRSTEPPAATVGGPALVLDGAGRPHVFYATPDEHRYAYWDGGQWRIETVDDTIGGWSSFSMFLALDGAGRPHVAYVGDPANDDLKYAYRDGGGWHVETVGSVAPAGARFSMALDASAHPHLAYCRLDGSHCVELRHAWWDGAQWQSESVDAAGDVGYYPSLALDGEDRPHISYHDDDNDALKYAYYDGSAWQIETLEGGNVGWYTSLSLDGDGHPHIAHYDVSMGDLRYTWWGP